mmetsp:Transcript_101085/g.286495  ORF Transcript_101085/g.286495 Transcript_101085/m.286495 type:complete len:354 (+) Transcript_101085:42-1103(+)
MRQCRRCGRGRVRRSEDRGPIYAVEALAAAAHQLRQGVPVVRRPLLGPAPEAGGAPAALPRQVAGGGRGPRREGGAAAVPWEGAAEVGGGGGARRLRRRRARGVLPPRRRTATRRQHVDVVDGAAGPIDVAPLEGPQATGPRQMARAAHLHCDHLDRLRGVGLGAVEGVLDLCEHPRPLPVGVQADDAGVLLHVVELPVAGQAARPEEDGLLLALHLPQHDVEAAAEHRHVGLVGLLRQAPHALRQLRHVQIKVRKLVGHRMTLLRDRVELLVEARVDALRHVGEPLRALLQAEVELHVVELDGRHLLGALLGGALQALDAVLEGPHPLLQVPRRGAEVDQAPEVADPVVQVL